MERMVNHVGCVKKLLTARSLKMSEENRIQIELFPNGCVHIQYYNRYGKDVQKLGLDIENNKFQIMKTLINIIDEFRKEVVNKREKS
jgi:hypothetical protein